MGWAAKEKKKNSHYTDESLLYDLTSLNDVWIILLSYIIMGRIDLGPAALDVSIPVINGTE